MPTLKIEKRNRLTISILYRIVVIFYSIFILIISKYAFEWPYNMLLYSLYGLFFILTHGKDKMFSYIRLINDFLFIFIILLQYRYIDVYSLALIFFPILNSQNHSGEKKSTLIYVFPLVILFILEKKFELQIIIPFLCFFIINQFESFRTKYIKLHEKMNSTIDNFFMEDSNVYRPYRIYKECIPLLNSKPFKLGIDEIYCFKYNKGKSGFNVVNGSNFVWSYNIDLNLNENKNSFVKNTPLVLNDKEMNNNITFIYKLPDSEVYYLFFIILKKSGFPLFDSFVAYNVLLNPLFLRLVKIFEADIKQKSVESKKMLELGAKMNYVNSAIMAMHFIRNKLSPIKNYISMLDDYNNADDDKKRKIEPFLTNERKNISTSLDLVLSRANYILENSNNPFMVSGLEKYGIQQLFSEIRRIWNEYDLTERFEINLNNENNDIRKYVFYNKTGMDLVLTNWISNIYRYNNGSYSLKIEETTNAYNITFANNIEQGGDIEFIKKFTNEDRLEIEKRKSHGLSELKEFLSQMKIQGKMSYDNGNVYLTLELVKQNESIDI